MPLRLAKQLPATQELPERALLHPFRQSETFVAHESLPVFIRLVGTATRLPALGLESLQQGNLRSFPAIYPYTQTVHGVRPADTQLDKFRQNVTRWQIVTWNHRAR